uniref:EF-hand domain-containing protein n=1 Tax=Alexandrium monilatum TaxID=311494 RepID=A0A7S4VIQ8_9DINO
MWADPGDEPGSRPNGTRDVSHAWGPDYTERFLAATGLRLVVRSHQVPRTERGVLAHEAHGGRVVTVFSASNYGGRGNLAGALLVHGAGSELGLAEVDLGLCPPWEAVAQLPLCSDEERAARRLLHSAVKRSSVDLASAQHRYGEGLNRELRRELLQQARSLLVEWRAPLWDKSTGRDAALTGKLGMAEWTRACREATGLRHLDWALLTRLLGGEAGGRVRYMDLLNRFGFRIESRVVRGDFAEGVLSEIYRTLLRADESLPQLLGELCSRGRAMPVEELLARFRELLARNGVAAAGMEAILRSLKAHLAARPRDTVDIAAFLSAWRCAAGVHVDLSPAQERLASHLACLLGLGPAEAAGDASGGIRNSRPSRLSRRLSAVILGEGLSEAPVGAVSLMDFFASADTNGDGYLDFAELEAALEAVLVGHGVHYPREEIQALVRAADVTGHGSLNYLEFLQLFDFQEARCLTHQCVLEALCFQAWSHRNALSGLFRYVGRHGLVRRSQLEWALGALNKVLDGGLAEENIGALVGAIDFADGAVHAEEFLHAFEIVDSRSEGQRQAR